MTNSLKKMFISDRFLMSQPHINKIKDLVDGNLIRFTDREIFLTMRKLDWVSTWNHIRTLQQNSWSKKSWNESKSTVSYFYDNLDFNKPILITEWEIDYLTLLPYYSNTIWLSWIKNLEKLVTDIISINPTAEIYMLIDNDETSQWEYNKIQSKFWNRILILDCRSYLGDNKDINEYFMKNKNININYVLWVWEIEFLRTVCINLNNISKRDLLSFLQSNAFIWMSISKKLEKAVNLLNCIDFNTSWEKWKQKVSINYSKLSHYTIDEYKIYSTYNDYFRYNVQEGIYEIVNKSKIWNISTVNLDIISQIGIPLSNRTSENIEKLIFKLTTDEKLESVVNRWEVNHLELCLKDYIYDIKSKKSRPYSPEDYKLFKLPYNMENINTSTPIKWLNFLESCFQWYPDSEEIISFLQEYVWYLLIPDTHFNYNLILYWESSTGKWTFLAWIANMLGEKNFASITLKELSRPEEINKLYWKLVWIDFDMAEWTKLDSHWVKKITAWEKVSWKILYKDEYTFKPFSRLICATNVMPYIRNWDNSTKRRWVIINFNNSFDSVINFNLKNEIYEEAEWIFFRALTGLNRLLERGKFIIPNSSEKNMNKFLNLHDYVEEILENKSIFLVDKANSSYKIKKIDCYKIYLEYMQSMNINNIMTKGAFYSEMEKKWFITCIWFHWYECFQGIVESNNSSELEFDILNPPWKKYETILMSEYGKWKSGFIDQYLGRYIKLLIVKKVLAKNNFDQIEYYISKYIKKFWKNWESEEVLDAISSIPRLLVKDIDDLFETETRLITNLESLSGLGTHIFF